MANQEHLNLLGQGVEKWDEWREEHSEEIADLSGADLSSAELGGANLSEAILAGADLSEADLSQANLYQADLDRAQLQGTYLVGTTLCGANLKGADLTSALMLGTNLSLNGSTLHGWVYSAHSTDLRGVNLSNAILDNADLSSTTLFGVIFAGIDLSLVKGLETVTHEGPSTIGIDTIIRSLGKIPEIFLRNAGVPDSIIEAIPSLVGSLSPIDYYSCFISYSSKDQAFAEQLHADLQRGSLLVCA